MEAQRQQLQKVLRPHWVWAIAVGSSIGWGAFVQPVNWLEVAGPLGVTIGFSIGALLMMVIAVSYGEVIQRFPVSGGEFAYAFVGMGRVHAFICGWFLTLGYICIVALNASALALLFRFLLPSIMKTGYLYTVAGWDVYLSEIVIGITSLALFGFFNARGSAISGRMQFLFCVVMVGSVFILALMMGTSSVTESSHLLPLFSPNQTAWAGVISIVAIAPWAFVGFDNVPQVAEEFNFSSKKAFSLIIFALIAAAVLYVLMIFSTAVAMPWLELSSTVQTWGTGEVIHSTLGIVGSVLLVIALSMGIFTGLNGFIISSSRLLFAMSRAKVLPEPFSRIHPKTAAPRMSIIFTILVAMIAPWFGRSALLWVVDMSSIGVSIAYFYTCFAAYKMFSWNESTEGRIVSPLKKSIALFGSLFSLGFIALLVVPQSPAFLSMPSLIALLLWILLGIIFFLGRRKAYMQLSHEELSYLIIGKTPVEENKI